MPLRDKEKGFTLIERFLCGLYTACVAIVGLRLFVWGFKVDDYAMFLATICFTSGAIIPPYLLNPQNINPLHSLITGCLTTLVAALSAGLILAVLGTKSGMDAFYFIVLMSVGVGFVFCLLGGPAMMLFSVLLSRYRQSEFFAATSRPFFDQPHMAKNTRLILACYMTFLGYITGSLITSGISYFQHPELGLYIKFQRDFGWESLVSLAAYFFPSYFLLPNRLSSNSYNGRRAFIGGTSVFFFATLIQALYFFDLTVTHYHNSNVTRRISVFESLVDYLPTTIIWGALLIPFGGLLSWLAYCYLYKNKIRHWYTIQS